MIIILHGPNTQSSYSRLQEIESEHKKGSRLKLSGTDTYEKLFEAVFGTSLLNDTKLVISQNFIKDKKVDFKKGAFDIDVPERTVVFYEQSQLTPTQLSKLPKHFKVEFFKNEPVIFYFLDSLSSSLKPALKSLQALNPSEDTMLIWQLANRFLLLVVAKTGLNPNVASKLTGRPIAPWQWQKIRQQASQFDLPTLKSIYSGLLKIDFMIKTGKSSLPPKTLISYLLLKYLRD